MAPRKANGSAVKTGKGKRGVPPRVSAVKEKDAGVQHETRNRGGKKLPSAGVPKTSPVVPQEAGGGLGNDELKEFMMGMILE